MGRRKSTVGCVYSSTPGNEMSFKCNTLLCSRGERRAGKPCDCEIPLHSQSLIGVSIQVCRSRLKIDLSSN